MNGTAGERRSEDRRATIAAGGILILLLGAAAALLPEIEGAGTYIGLLLVFAGTIELVAGAARGHGRMRGAAMLAGAVTAVAGLLFLSNPFMGLFPVSYVVIAWLLLRAGILLTVAYFCSGVLKTWGTVGGLADFGLALVLIAGLPVATLVTSLFGPTQEVVASFSLIFAASFAVTGVLLLAIAFSRGPGTD